jgi:hypothetical protein
MDRRRQASAGESAPDALNFVFDVFAKGTKDDAPPRKDPAGLTVQTGGLIVCR